MILLTATISGGRKFFVIESLTAFTIPASESWPHLRHLVHVDDERVIRVADLGRPRFLSRLEQWWLKTLGWRTITATYIPPVIISWSPPPESGPPQCSAWLFEGPTVADCQAQANNPERQLLLVLRRCGDEFTRYHWRVTHLVPAQPHHAKVSFRGQLDGWPVHIMLTFAPSDTLAFVSLGITG